MDENNGTPVTTNNSNQDDIQNNPLPSPAQSEPTSDQSTAVASDQTMQSATPTQADDPLITDKTFEEDLDARWCNWKCLVCGFVYESVIPKNVCPRCGNSDPDKLGD